MVIFSDEPVPLMLGNELREYLLKYFQPSVVDIVINKLVTSDALSITYTMTADGRKAIGITPGIAVSDVGFIFHHQRPRP